MRTRQLKPGMRIDQSIEDRLGRVLVAKGSLLDEYVIDSMLKLGIMSVYISEGEPEEQPKEEPTCPLAQRNIAQYRTEDKSKVSLSNSVRKRVSEGIQYIYNNTESQHFSDTTDTITNDLMSAIENNDAVAIDIGALKTSDEYTFKHSVDVATIAMVLAKQQGFSKKQIYEIGVAGLLHDIGKTKVPLEILNKPGKLDDQEFAIMKQHSVFGYKMIKDRSEYNNAISIGILQHHEKINGKGYPMGVANEQITKYAKILSVADIYDALVTERPYKKAFSQRAAIELIMTMTEELDMVAMQSFLDSIILYPVDSIVELSNGERAKVVKNQPHFVLRPTVVSLSTGKVYDLGEDVDCANIIIN